MGNLPDKIVDRFGRAHNYLRLSLTERCNLRCFYCMPPEGVQLSPPASIMTAREIGAIARAFVSLGINKIRLTGGEPLVRKDFEEIVRDLAKLPVELALTTNGILIDRYFDVLKETGLKKINISLDSLKEEKFSLITRRNYFKKVMDNIHLLLANGIIPKINVVLIKGTNEDEIIDFAELTRHLPLEIQFIEFMPFNGNKWEKKKGIYYPEIMQRLKTHYGAQEVESLASLPNDTSRNFRVKGYKGSLGMINTVSNPFCDSCNRIRLTANGRIKNCLFSQEETDLLAAFRRNENIAELILESIYSKKKTRGGIDDFSANDAAPRIKNNRSMVLIGG